MTSGLRLRDQRGFTIIEVLVAAMLLVIGILGTIALVDTSNARTNQNKGREGATNLAREVVENARTIGYKQLQPYTVEAELQAMPGLASQSSGTVWTVKRRGFTYTLNVSVCAVDDPKDGYGSHAGAAFCADSASTGTADPQAEDLKRVTVDVSWQLYSKTQTLRQVALIAGAGAKGPAVTSLVATAPVVPDPAAPVITSSAISSVTFKATVPAGVSSVIYSLDGEDKGNATVAANGTDWTFTLPISGLSDGGYDVSVRAVDSRGVAGPSFAIPLKLIRSQPAAPTGLVAGANKVYRNGSLVDVVELAWQPNPERNVIGYRVYTSGSALVCPANMQTLDLAVSCIDFTATGGTYAVAALYRDASGAVAEGPRSTVSVPASSPSRTYYFKKTTANTTNTGTCLSSFRVRDMEEGYTGLDPEESFKRQSQNNTLNFCSPAFAASVSLPAGTTTVNAQVSNTSGSSCNITATLYKNGTTSLGSTTVTIGLRTSDLRTWTFSNLAANFAAGDRLNLHFAFQQVSACGSTDLFYGGTVNRSSVTVPLPSAAPVPDPVTNLSASLPGDGTTALNWSAPAGGSAISFYRIYRDGIDHTNRFDTAGSPTDPTYIDAQTDGVSHTYYVTAVSANLTESAMVGPVTQ